MQKTPEIPAAKLLSIKTASRQLDVSLRQAYQLVYDRQIEHVRIGRSLKIRQDALDAFIARNTVGVMKT